MDKAFEITDGVMEKINRYTISPLTAENVYCFSVILCDNEVDRDCEKFSVSSLTKLAEYFLGKTGIFDHDPKGSKQTARLFDVEVKTQASRLTVDGEEYTYLEGKAYMVRTAENSGLIAEIGGGIKKEVSVSCSVGKKICSICGSDLSVSPCVHQKGKEYGGKLCFVILEEPSDAYEWSFVAVPAQINAGVTKKFSGENFQRGISEQGRQLSLAKDFLRGEILSLSYFAKPFRTAEQVKSATKSMDFCQLLDLRKALFSQVQSGAQKSEEELSFITQGVEFGSENGGEYSV